MKKNTQQTIELVRWDKTTLKQIKEVKKVPVGGAFICAGDEEGHKYCRHMDGEIVLRKGTKIKSISIFSVSNLVTVYLDTPDKEDK